ncbi:MAG TPA: hypothetical protein VFN35_33350 [Ktedonobacteraceae bacterium]|nr:hypothetical protein [Ktedonobacteraceae bacterium]
MIAPAGPGIKRRRWPIRPLATNLGCFFFLALIFLGFGLIPSFINFPGFQARFTGIGVIAVAKAVSSCEDDGNVFAFLFTDQRGEARLVTDDNTCFSGIYHDGQQVEIWYQPENPAHFITNDDLTFDLIFAAGFSIPLIIWLVLSLLTLFLWIRSMG